MLRRGMVGVDALSGGSGGVFDALAGAPRRARPACGSTDGGMRADRAVRGRGASATGIFS